MSSLRHLGLVALLCAVTLSLAPPSLAQVPDGYLIVPAPAAGRGVLMPIGGNPAYGYTYLSPRGWFEATLPSGAVMNASEGDSVSFSLTSGGVSAICLAVAYPEAKRRQERFEQLQLSISGLLTPGGQWDRSATEAVTVTERSVLELKDGGRIPVKLASWTGTDRAGRYMTVGLIELPGGTLALGCDSPTAAKAKYLTTMVFRLAEGAL